MHQRKGKKILLYFFLLILVCSINNISFSNLKFDKINDINIIGLGDKNNAILFQEIEKLNLDNIFTINGNKIANQISSNNIIEEYDIFKKYPSSLNINIKKTKFLARISDKKKIYLVGTNGKLSKNDFSNDQLPFIFGKPVINKFLNFKKIIDVSEISYEDIKNLYFFSTGRWDIELNNNVVIKLSKNDTKESLQLALEFLYSSEFKDIKIIDARIKNQIILND